MRKGTLSLGSTGTQFAPCETTSHVLAGVVIVAGSACFAPSCPATLREDDREHFPHGTNLQPLFLCARRKDLPHVKYEISPLQFHHKPC